VHGGDGEGSLLTVLFWDIDTAKGGWLVVVRQKIKGSRFALGGGGPENTINTRSALTLVGGDSFDSQHFGVERACEETLEGFNLPPSPLLNGLCDAEL